MARCSETARSENAPTPADCSRGCRRRVSPVTRQAPILPRAKFARPGKRRTKPNAIGEGQGANRIRRTVRLLAGLLYRRIVDNNDDIARGYRLSSTRSTSCCRNWRWGQSSANSSLFRLSLFCGKMQGNSSNSDGGRRLTSAFVVEIQSPTSRIP